jgi:hypothetical protein
VSVCLCGCGCGCVCVSVSVYVSLQAGGKEVTWDERLTFQQKELTDSTLTVRVFDKDSLSDDLQGECDVDLHVLDLRENEEREVRSVDKALLVQKYKH